MDSLLNKIDLLNSCRLCLNNLKDDKTNIFSIICFNNGETKSNKKISEIITETSSIKIEDENDIFSKYLCKYCLKNILQFFKFISNCQYKNDKLKDFINSTKLLKNQNETIQIEPTVLIENETDFKVLGKRIKSNKIDLDYERDNNSDDLKSNKNVSVKKRKKDAGSKNQSGSISCELCGKNNFITKMQLTNHLKKHKLRKRFKKCPYCNQIYNLCSFYKHVARHRRDKKYMCSVCGKRFNTGREEIIHMRVHTNERPYKCDYPGCESTFKTSSNKTQHYRIHTLEKPHLCDICSKSFSSSSTLKNHKRIHTGELPFKCRYCDKCFNKTSNCKAHEKRKHKIMLDFKNDTSYDQTIDFKVLY